MSFARILRPAVFSVVLLYGCTPYQPSGLRGGFSETATAPATEIVTFSSNELTTRERTKMMLLYRCAQITRQNGYSYFIITGDNRGFQFPSNPLPGAYAIPNTAPPQSAELGIPGLMSQPYQDPDSTLPVAVGPLRVDSLAVAPDVTALEYEIKMFKGVKPADNHHAYYVSDVMETLGPELGLPQKLTPPSGLPELGVKDDGSMPGPLQIFRCFT